MYSSLSNQSSYQDENLSFFTYSFVQSLKEHPSTEIRYKDIIDFILDEFTDNVEQTPFFVLQAELTEKFCAFNEDLKHYLVNYSIANRTPNKDEKKAPSLLEMVKINAKEYVDKEGALKALDFCKVQFEKLSIDKEFKDLYNLEINFIEDNNSLPGVKSIGKWIKDNNNNNNFFATPYYSEIYSEYDDEPVTYLSGYQSLIEDAPFKAISIEILSKFPNLKSYQCNIALLVSKKQISFFYVILQYLENGWDNKTLDVEKIKWTYSNKKIANNDSLLEGLKNITFAINDKIKSDINVQFGLKNEEDNDEHDDLPF